MFELVNMNYKYLGQISLFSLDFYQISFIISFYYFYQSFQIILILITIFIILSYSNYYSISINIPTPLQTIPSIYLFSFHHLIPINYIIIIKIIQLNYTLNNMFSKQINKPNHSNINCLTQSKSQKLNASFKRKINLPSTIFNKSPLRQRQNKQIIGNTPIRKTSINNIKLLQPTEPPKRISISPLRNRRQLSNLTQASNHMIESTSSARNIATINLSINSQVNKSRKLQSGQIKEQLKKIGCQNHKNKQARYIIVIDEEQQIPYCEKCAILLASQGFKVRKIEQQEEQTNPRTLEVSMFLQDLTNLVKILTDKKNQIQSQIHKNDQTYVQQSKLIQNYYQNIVQMINKHKQSILTNQNNLRLGGQAQAKQDIKILEQIIKQSNEMQDDIYVSQNLIRQAQQNAFRTVMQSYKDKVKNFKQTSRFQISKIPECKTMILNTNILNITNEYLRKIQSRIQDQVIKREIILPIMKSQQQNKGNKEQKHEQYLLMSDQEQKINFSFDNGQQNRFSGHELIDSEKDQNPVQHLSEEQDLMMLNDKLKCSTKQQSKGGFFADFNQ